MSRWSSPQRTALCYNITLLVIKNNKDLQCLQDRISSINFFFTLMNKGPLDAHFHLASNCFIRKLWRSNPGALVEECIKTAFMYCLVIMLHSFRQVPAYMQDILIYFMNNFLHCLMVLSHILNTNLIISQLNFTCCTLNPDSTFLENFILKLFKIVFHSYLLFGWLYGPLKFPWFKNWIVYILPATRRKRHLDLL